MNTDLARSRFTLAYAAALLALSLPVAAAIPGIELVDRTNIPAYVDSNGDSPGPLALSTDGRYTLFRSSANNLVAGDTNGVMDVFLHDANDDSIERVNVASDGSQANAAAEAHLVFTQRGSVSDDGRFVTFTSAATNLVAEPTGGYVQLYRRDRATGATTLISRGTDGLPASTDVAGGASTPDGRYTVLFTNAANFPDTDGRGQVYRYDATDGSMVRVTVSYDGKTTDATQNQMEISDDGRFVLFSSYADNLVPGGTAGSLDVFLRDVLTGTTQQVSVTDTGAPSPFPPWGELEDVSSIQRLSSDGRYSILTTSAPLTASDVDGRVDVYRFDRLSGTTTLISTEVGGVAPLAFNAAPSISADGSRVLFFSGAIDPPALLMVRDMTAGTLTSLAVPATMNFYRPNLTLSRNGLQVYINSGELPPRNGFRNVYRFDIASGTLTRLSRAMATSIGAYANGAAETSARPSPSADGNWVAFASMADNLVAGDANAVSDVFVRDRAGATTVRISLAQGGGESSCASTAPTMTPDARYVVFVSCGALTAPASGDQDEIYRYDRVGGAIDLISIGTGGNRADGDSYEPHVSVDGRHVTFGSCASNLVATTGGAACQIYLRDVDTGTTERVSRSTSGNPASAGFSSAPFISGNGRFVGYTSGAANLVPNDTNGASDAFVFDRLAATTERISVATAGTQASSSSTFRGFDHGGNLALFESASTNLTGTALNVEQRTYLRDRAAGTTTLLAIPGDARAGSIDPAISPDGRFVALISHTADSGAGPFDDSRLDKLFVLDRAQGTYRALTWFTQATPVSLTRKPQLSADGRTIAFASMREDLTNDDGNGAIADIFVAHVDDAIFADSFE